MERFEISSKCSEIHTFQKLIESICDSILKSEHNVHLYLPMKCEDMNHTFLVNEILFRYDKLETLVHLDIYYNVFHTMKKQEFIFTYTMEKIELTEKVVEFIFSIFFHYKLCVECLKLIKDEGELCSICTLHKYRNVYAKEKGWLNEQSSNCSICCCPVYNTKLQCGHYIHHTCLIQLLPFQWYYPSDIQTIKKLKCPLCRQSLTEYDLNRYFRCK